MKSRIWYKILCKVCFSFFRPKGEGVFFFETKEALEISGGKGCLFDDT